MKRTHYGCSVEGCDQKHKAQTYCSAHYARFLRGTLDKPHTRRTGCDFPGCDREHFGKGYCSAHYVQHVKGRGMSPIRVREPAPEHCAVTGCLEPHKARSFCRWHYDRYRRGADMTILRTDPPAPKPKAERKPKASKATKAARVIPRGWDKVTKPKPPTTARRTGGGSAQSVLTDALIPLPLDMLAKAVAVVDKLGARDCLDALGIRELHHARTVWAERTGCAA